MKIALAQISSHLGNVKKNFDLHLNNIEKAKKNNVDLLIFPELSLTGYTLQDLVGEVALSPDSDPMFDKLKTASRDVLSSSNIGSESGDRATSPTRS